MKELRSAPPVKLMSKSPSSNPFPRWYMNRHEGDAPGAYLKWLFELHAGEVRSCDAFEKTERGWVKRIRAWSLARLLDKYGHVYDLDTIYSYCTSLTVAIPKKERSKRAGRRLASMWVPKRSAMAGLGPKPRLGSQWAVFSSTGRKASSRTIQPVPGIKTVLLRTRWMASYV